MAVAFYIRPNFLCFAQHSNDIQTKIFLLVIYSNSKVLYTVLVMKDTVANEGGDKGKGQKSR